MSEPTDEKDFFTVNGWICVPVSTEVEAESADEANDIGYEKLAAEHGEQGLEIEEVVKQSQ